MIDDPEAPLPNLATCEKSRLAEERAWDRILNARDAGLAKPAKRGSLEKSTDRAEVQRIARLAKQGKKANAAAAMKAFRKDVESR